MRACWLRPVIFGLQYTRGNPIDNGEGGDNGGMVEVTLKATPRASITVSGDYKRNATAQQYVTAIPDSTAPVGFGNTRYVFGRIQQKRRPEPPRPGPPRRQPMCTGG